jgi:hypothetical protein
VHSAVKKNMLHRLIETIKPRRATILRNDRKHFGGTFNLGVACRRRANGREHRVQPVRRSERPKIRRLRGRQLKRDTFPVVDARRAGAAGAIDVLTRRLRRPAVFDAPWASALEAATARVRGGAGCGRHGYLGHERRGRRGERQRGRKCHVQERGMRKLHGRRRRGRFGRAA